MKFIRSLVLLALVPLATSLPAATAPDPLITAIRADIDAQKALNTKLVSELSTLSAQVGSQANSVTTLTAKNATLTTTNAALTKQVADLQAKIGTPTTTIPPTPPTTFPTTADVITDHLGKSYAEYDHAIGTTFPDQYLRATIPTPAGSYRQFTNEGLGTWSTVAGDFSSTQAQVVFVPDVALTVDKTVEPWKLNGGIGVARLEVENMSNNSFSAVPLLNSLPETDASGWVEFNSVQHENLGQPIGIARGYGRWSNAGFVLFNRGYIGTAGTSTARSPWSGFLLPANKKPTAICVTSGNEFVLVTVIDTDTGKGQLAVISLWGGQDLQAKALGSGFYHDWPVAHPSLGNPAVVTGMKLLGYIDLGISAPSGVSAIGSPTSNRVSNKTDGNAGSLAEFDLNTQADRDAFNYRKGGTNQWANSVWGFAVVISRTENKAVYVSFDKLFAGVYDQYFTTQDLYDATKPKDPAANWYAMFGAADTDWPYTFAGKPEWTPTVVATLDVPSPTAVLLSENDQRQDNAVAIASEDGTIRFWKGRPPVADGSLTVGRNVTCLTYDKFPSQTGTRRGGFIAVSRGDRSIHFVNTWGNGAQVTKTLRDARLLDPVSAEVADTHGLDGGVLSVADYSGRKILNYRYTPLNLVNFGNQVFGMGADGTADFECDGVLILAGKPFAVSGTNVN